MAEGKKSVLLYCDIIHTIEKMDNETAGLFFKHYLRYINDLNPETDNQLIDIAFESVKQNLKRDLIKWEKRADASRENGLLGGRPKKKKEPKEPSRLINNLTEPRKPVTVTVKDTVNVKEIKKEKEVFEFISPEDLPPIPIEYDKKQFCDSWNRLKSSADKKPSNLNHLSTGDIMLLRQITKSYNKERIECAMKALFIQKTFPNNNTVMRNSPTHFLNHINSYVSAYDEKNDKIYGEKINQ